MADEQGGVGGQPGRVPPVGDLLPRVLLTDSGIALVRTVRRGGSWQRVLAVGGVWQSATFLDARRMEPAFEYFRGFSRVFDLVPDLRRLLVIGGGGFSFPKLVAAEHPSVTTDVVEVDPAVIGAARRWFFLDEACELHREAGGELNAICDDGRAFLDAAAPGSYDAVVLDAFSGSVPARALATREAAEAARRALSERGVLVANVVRDAGGPGLEFLRSVVAGLLGPFSHVAVTLVEDDRSEGENYLVFASGAPLDLPDAIPFDEDFLGPVPHD